MTKSALPKVLMIVGATASGKSELAIQIAEALPAEIISADSRSFYKELNIGVAKPSHADLGRAKHQLIDVTDIDHPWSLGEFQAAANALISEIHKQAKLPILVGGTGQYLRAISENWQVPPHLGNEALRIAISKWGERIGFESLHQKLSQIDSEAATTIDYRNHRRTIRAFEVLFLSGKRFSALKAKGEPLYEILTIGLAWPREELYARVDQRIQAMLDAGLVAEVSDLISAGKTSQLRRVGVIGYSEVLGYLEGEYSLEESIDLIRRNTRRFIRHQANWFKPSDPSIHWFNTKDPGVLDQVLGLVNTWLSA